MARIDALPSLDIIRGLKGVLDFYVWRGLPCVRAWPRYRPARQTEASLAAALLFGAIVKAYSLLASAALEAYQEMATAIPRTARDVYVSGVYGNLHEAAMSDFLDLLTQCRDALVLLTAINDALHSIATDAWDVHVHASVLPPDAATHTGQGTQLVALQKIDDLQDALESKALDRLLVRGMDQVFSYKGPLLSRTDAVISGAGGFIQSASPPAGQAWAVTTVTARDLTSPTTAHDYLLRDAGNFAAFYREVAAFPAAVFSSWSGLTLLEPGDVVEPYFVGSLGGDNCRVSLTGTRMTLET